MNADTIIDKVVGLTMDAAIALITSEGLKWRVESEDGKGNFGTDDWLADRIKLDLVDGKVSKANVG